MNLDTQPTLRGEHVTIRPMRAEDHDPLYAIGRDPQVWAGHPAKDRWQPEVFDRFFAEGLASGGGVVVEDAQGRIVGTSRFYEVSEEAAFIGWTFLARERWGDGTNAEVKRLMVEHVHASGRDARFHVGHSNGRSRAAMAKVGGVVVVESMPDRPDHMIFEIARP